MRYAPASFRDPDARMLDPSGGRMLRVLSERAAATDGELRASGLMAELVRDGLMVENTRCDDVPVPDGWAALVESKRVPFVNYPFEWSFSMLKDAALVTLRLTERVLERGMALKDASAYNVLFHGARPTFIDVASVESYQEGMPWIAYGQFCDHFLAPLMLEAYKGIRFQPFLRGNLDGLSITDCLAPLLSGLDVRRPGVLVHVRLRAFLDRRSRRLGTAMRAQVRRATVPKAAVLRNLRGLARIVASLRSRVSSAWVHYDDDNTYDRQMAEHKATFIHAACERLGRQRLAWDVGANTGRYSRILARHFEAVVAMDADPGAVDRFYTELKGTTEEGSVLPLVVDLMNPSPAQGWRGAERQSLFSRGRPDLAVYLALVHHICLGQGVPLGDFVNMVHETSETAIVEFVTADDSMSQSVLATKVAVHGGYDLATFRTLVAKRSTILAELSLSPSRSLFLLQH